MAIFNGTDNGDLLPSILQSLGAQGDDTINGRGGDDIIAGFLGNDVLTGGSGADVIIGGVLNIVGGIGGISLGGIDTADYTGSGAGVQVNLASTSALNINLLGINIALTDAVQGTGGDAQGDTLYGMLNLNGSAFADRLGGEASANILIGAAGDDILHGGGGGDTLNGGAGNDFANYQQSAGSITVDLLANTASGGDAAGDTLTSIENLYGSSNADRLTGDNGANIIGGELGDDILVGNGGNDTLTGEGGNDTIRGGDGADRLIGGDGVDTINGGNDNDSIDAGTGNDVVSGVAGDDNLTGGLGNDRLDGGDGNDVVTGGVGEDDLIGGAGDKDTASYAGSAAAVTANLATGTGIGGDAQGDTYTEIENLYGSSQADLLTGDAGVNILSGLNGNDILTGGVGADMLKGGAGNDTCVYTGVADSTVAPAGKDLIVSFTTGDKIDLSAIDADGNAGNGDTAFSFGPGGFTGNAGEARIVDFGNGFQAVYLDTTGDRVPESIINVFTDHALTANDFTL